MKQKNGGGKIPQGKKKGQSTAQGGSEENEFTEKSGNLEQTR